MADAVSYRPLRDTDPGQYYSVTQAARILQVSPSTVWRWIEANRLPAYRIGPKAIRIRKHDLDAVISPTSADRKGMTEMKEQASGTTPARFLTDEEVRQGLEALASLRALRRDHAARHFGEPSPPRPSSDELIRQEREERSRRL